MNAWGVMVDAMAAQRWRRESGEADWASAATHVQDAYREAASSDLAVAMSVTISDDCLTCSGTGFVDGAPCATCGGDGHVNERLAYVEWSESQ